MTASCTPSEGYRQDYAHRDSRPLETAAELVDSAVVLNVGVIMEGTMKDLENSRGVLRDSGLEPPPVSRQFDAISGMGYPVGSPPVSMDQGAAELTKVIDREARNRASSNDRRSPQKD